MQSWKRGEIDWDSGEPSIPCEDVVQHSVTAAKLENVQVHKLLVYLRLDSLPNLLALISILGGAPKPPKIRIHPQSQSVGDSDSKEELSEAIQDKKSVLQAHGVRLLPLTERDSSVMKVSEVDDYLLHDPVVNTFKTVAHLNNMAISGTIDIVPESSFADTLISRASDACSDLLLLPWSETGRIDDSQLISKDSVRNKLTTDAYGHFVNSILTNASCNTAVFVNNGFGGVGYRERYKLSRTTSTISRWSGQEKMVASPIADHGHHIFMPFFGGANDRIALRLLLHMAENTDITATILRLPISKDTPEIIEDWSAKEDVQVRPNRTHSSSVNSDGEENDESFVETLRKSLAPQVAPRIIFETKETSDLLSEALARADFELGKNLRNAGDLIVVGRKSLRRAAVKGGLDPPPAPVTDVGSCLGVVAEAIITRKLKTSILVIQASPIIKE